MKTIRIITWLIVAVLVCILTYAWYSKNSGYSVAISPQQNQIKIGGPFNLVRHDGTPISEKDLDERYHAIFFGFTHCPEICPTTLLDATNWLAELDDDADKIDFYFFTVDPERDTPEALKDYLSSFDPRIVGVSGDPKEMTKTIQSYKIYAEKVDIGDDDYTMEHSAMVLLFRKNGTLLSTISFNENEETALAKLRKLIR